VPLFVRQFHVGGGTHTCEDCLIALSVGHFKSLLYSQLKVCTCRDRLQD